MGLDMYFSAKTSTWRSYGAYEKDDSKKFDYPEELKAFQEHILKTNFMAEEVSKCYDIGYFRKFNALHGYIVENCADEVDECQEIYVPKECIEDLLDICKQIDADHSLAEDLLPTTPGFFFGSNEYDDYYFQDIKSAIEMFTLILEKIDFSKYLIVYKASW